MHAWAADWKHVTVSPISEWPYWKGHTTDYTAGLALQVMKHTEALLGPDHGRAQPIDGKL